MLILQEFGLQKAGLGSILAMQELEIKIFWSFSLELISIHLSWRINSLLFRESKSNKWVY